MKKKNFKKRTGDGLILEFLIYRSFQTILERITQIKTSPAWMANFKNSPHFLLMQLLCFQFWIETCSNFLHYKNQDVDAE